MSSNRQATQQRPGLTRALSQAGALPRLFQLLKGVEERGGGLGLEEKGFYDGGGDQEGIRCYLSAEVDKPCIYEAAKAVPELFHPFFMEALEFTMRGTGPYLRSKAKSKQKNALVTVHSARRDYFGSEERQLQQISDEQLERAKEAVLACRANAEAAKKRQGKRKREGGRQVSHQVISPGRKRSATLQAVENNVESPLSSADLPLND